MVPRNKIKGEGGRGVGWGGDCCTSSDGHECIPRLSHPAWKNKKRGFCIFFCCDISRLVIQVLRTVSHSRQKLPKTVFSLSPLPCTLRLYHPHSPPSSPTSRGLHFLRRGGRGGGTCYERTNIVLTRTCLPRSLEKGYRRTVVGFLTSGVHLRVS